MKMKPEQQRLKIAEACGWRFVPMHKSKELGFWYLNIAEKDIETANSGKLKGATPFYELPDYLNSLDAMADAERALNDPRKLTYIQELQSIICGKSSPSYDWVNSLLPSSKLCVFATAAQRAESLLRTLNLWESE